MEGYVIVLGLWTYGLLATASVGAALISSLRCAALPPYWLLVAVSVGAIAIVLVSPLEVTNQSIGLESYLSAFSLLGVAIFVASLVALGLAFSKQVWLRALSGASWGLAELVVVRIARLLSTG